MLTALASAMMQLGGDVRQAVNFADRALLLDPNHAWAWMRRGGSAAVIQRAQGRPKPAERPAGAANAVSLGPSAQRRPERGPRPGPLVPPRQDDRLRIAVSEAEPPAFAEELAGALDASLVHLGSGGGKTATVVEDECDAYIHTSGHHQWDSAATFGVVCQRGLHASHLDGSELRYNVEEIELPDLLVCRQDVAERIIDAVAGYL